MSKFGDLPIKQTEEIVDFGRDASGRTSQDLAKQYLQGVDQVYSQAPHIPQVAWDGGGMGEALERRIMGRQKQDMGILKQNTQMEAINDRFQRLQAAATLTAQEHAFNENARMNRAMQRANRRRARGAVLGNILGIAGAGIGTIGGAPGVMAGYAVGQGAGNLVGGGI